VELAVLSAGIHSRRKIVEQSLIEHAPRKRAVEESRIDADDDRLEPVGDELAGEHGSGPPPERKHRPFADHPQTRLAVPPDVLEEQVPEGDRIDVPQASGCERLRHALLVLLVRTPDGDLDLDQRDVRRRCLPREQLAPRAVHRDPVIVPRHGRDQGLGPQPVRLLQRPQRQR